MSPLRSFLPRVISLVVALFCLAAPAAQAKGRVIVPPGSSAASQYVEVIPTANGNRPAASLTPGGSGGPTSGSSSGASGSGGSASSGPLSKTSVKRAFHHHGAAGAAALALAQATGQAAVPTKAPAVSGSTGTGSAGNSPLASLVKAATGSSTGGAGLGSSLPIIFVLIAIGGVFLARRPRGTA